MISRPSPMRPQAKVEIVKQSRDRWKDDAGTFAAALNATQLILVHGDRAQQVKAAADARQLLRFKGYPAKNPHTKRFNVTVRTANGYQFWNAIGHNSMDVLLDTLQHFDGQAVSVSVRVGA